LLPGVSLILISYSGFYPNPENDTEYIYSIQKKKDSDPRRSASLRSLVTLTLSSAAYSHMLFSITVSVSFQIPSPSCIDLEMKLPISR